MNAVQVPEGATMNDYVQVDFGITPSEPDACDLLADALGAAGYESFVPADDGSAMSAYVPAPLFDEKAVETAVAGLPFGCEVTVKATFVPGRDWNSEWEKNYFKPIVVEGCVAVHSSFHTDVPEARYDIVIDPKMAFGTGHHATTTLMMKSLLSSVPSGMKVVDMGTGTGILAILAAMLGASEVFAVEIDPFAAANARDNVLLNLGDSNAVTVVQGDASSLGSLDWKADIFLANINRNIITSDIARYSAVMAPDAKITVSGFYVSDRPVVEAAAREAGLELMAVDEMDNWSSMTFRKKA